MAFDLEQLRLDIPAEDLSRPEGVWRGWRVLALLLIPGLAALAWLHFIAAPPEAELSGIPVRTHVVGQASAAGPAAFTAGGWIEPQWPHPSVVASAVPGRIERLWVQEGSSLKAGQVIAQLVMEPIEAEQRAAHARLAAAEAREKEAQAHLDRLRAGPRPQELAVAQAELASARAAVARLEAGFRTEDIEQATAELRRAETLAGFARARAARYSAMYEQNLIPKLQADEIESEAAAAEAHAKALGHALDRLRKGYRDVDIGELSAAATTAQRRLELLQAGPRAEEVAQAEAALEFAQAELATRKAEAAQADWRMEQCEIRAPSAGRVLESLAAPGTLLTEEKPNVVTMYDPARMQARVDIRQEQAAALFVGQPCTIKLEARKGQPYAGEVIRIDPAANLARDTIRARVKILEPDDVLRKDMTVTVDFLPRQETGQGASTLVLPPSAITRRDGRDHVFMIRDGRAWLRPVVLGAQVASGITVESGVAAGDLVAVSSLPLLQDGVLVRLDLGAP